MQDRQEEEEWNVFKNRYSKTFKIAQAVSGSGGTRNQSVELYRLDTGWLT